MMTDADRLNQAVSTFASDFPSVPRDAVASIVNDAYLLVEQVGSTAVVFHALELARLRLEIRTYA